MYAQYFIVYIYGNLFQPIVTLGCPAIAEPGCSGSTVADAPAPLSTANDPRHLQTRTSKR